jgi:cyclophilin family peptidyl-prolyl cis-trans isomerase
MLPPKGEKETKVLISTEYGHIKIKLYNETPKHRDNFIKLVKEGFYNETLFHRVIASFMIQGGDPDSKGAAAGKALGEGGTGYTIPAEIKSTLIHKKGALSAARMGDNVNPMRESSGCQFYIVQGKKATKKELDQMSARSGSSYTEEQVKIYETIGGTPFLDMNYTVFGEVIEGLDVVDKIAAVEKDRRDRPKKDVKMTMKIVKK